MQLHRQIQVTLNICYLNDEQYLFSTVLTFKGPIWC